MGLLDDAIKEHLELKRKHGAAEEELRRQETEALGPARRDFSTADERAEETAVAPLPSDEAAAGYEPEPAQPEPRGWLDEEEETPAPPAPAEPVPSPPPPAEPAAAEPPRAPEPEPLEHAAEAAGSSFAEEPVPAPDPAPAPRTSDTPTQGFDALSLDEEVPEAEEGEDVLEETPDFLQDTPEHDRLWFEQKPPRDFDFDE